MADSADDLLKQARQALYDWTVADDRTDAEWNASARLNSAFEMLDHLLSSGGPLPAAWADCDVPVEYVITAGLEAAMAADPHREDGAIIRVTDGKREAYTWKAATKEWGQVQ